MSLFQQHIERQHLLDSLAHRLSAKASILALHAWYQSSGGVLEPNLAAAAADAQAAATILAYGKEAKDGKA